MKTICLSVLALLISAAATAQASIQVTPSEIEFGSVRTGFSEKKTVTIYNRYNNDISLRYSLCFGDINPKTEPCNKIRKNGRCSFKITFAPRRFGSDSCSLTISVVSGGTAQKTISISGQGYGPGRFDTFEFDPIEQLLQIQEEE